MLVLSSTLLARFSCCEDRIGLSRKVGSTTAYQAFLPINLAKREIYWTMDYPAGIADIERRDIIDVDEAGIFLKIANRKYGKVSVGSRVRMGGQYGHSLKYTMTIVISGSEHGERWMDFEQKAGTDIASFYDFIVPILDDIGPGLLSAGDILQWTTCLLTSILCWFRLSLLQATVLFTGHPTTRLMAQ